MVNYKKSFDTCDKATAYQLNSVFSPTTATAGKQYYVSAKAATTFTITIDTAHSSDISFDWQEVI